MWGDGSGRDPDQDELGGFVRCDFKVSCVADPGLIVGLQRVTVEGHTAADQVCEGITAGGNIKNQADSLPPSSS